MKKINLYVCDVCGANYNEKSKCERCEKGHVKPKEIIGTRYLSLEVNKKGYPISIDVKMDNGDVVKYKR